MRMTLLAVFLATVLPGTLLTGQETHDPVFRYSDGELVRIAPDGSRRTFDDLGQVVVRRDRTFFVWDGYRPGYTRPDRQGVYVFETDGTLLAVIEGPSSVESYEVDPFFVTDDGEFVVQRAGTWIIGMLNVYSVADAELVYRAKATVVLETDGALLFGTVYDGRLDFEMEDEFFQIARLDLRSLTVEVTHPSTYDLDDDRVLTVRNHHLSRDGSVRSSETRYKERVRGSGKFYRMAD